MYLSMSIELVLFWIQLINVIVQFSKMALELSKGAYNYVGYISIYVSQK